jgi:GntR family transcriptional regulator, transcriptional repressor for pyruvate dehydrogenase complex
VAAAGRPAQHRQADSRFHLTVATLTGSPRMIEAVTSVQAVLHEMLLAIPVLSANIAHSDRQHAIVVRAILAGKPDRARRAMEEHCDDTAALLRGLVG